MKDAWAIALVILTAVILVTAISVGSEWAASRQFDRFMTCTESGIDPDFCKENFK